MINKIRYKKVCFPTDNKYASLLMTSRQAYGCTVGTASGKVTCKRGTAQWEIETKYLKRNKLNLYNTQLDE